MALTCRSTAVFDYLASKWVGCNPLPVYFTADNTKYPINTTDDIDTFTTVVDNGGFAQIELITTYETYVLGEFIEITDSTSYNGIHRIKEIIDADTFVLYTAFTATDTGLAQRYYNNYFTVFKIQVGIPADNTLASNNALVEVGSVRVRPDSSNTATANISEYIQSELVPILNDLCNSDLPNAWQEWTGFKVLQEEEYDSVDSAGLIETTNSGTIATSDTLYAVNGNQQAQYEFGSSMGEYELNASSGASRKFMTHFDTPTHFKGYPFTLSIICPVEIWTTYGDTLGNPLLEAFIEQFDSSGNSLGTFNRTLSNLDSDSGDRKYGLYRIVIDDIITLDSSCASYTIYIRETSATTTLSETKTVNYVQSSCPYPYFMQWLNHLGGWDCWLFKGVKDYTMDTTDSDVMKRDLFTDGISSYINGTTEHDVIRVQSREGIKVRSWDLTDNELDVVREILRSIKVFNWDSSDCGEWIGRTMLVDKSTVQYKTDIAEINTLEFDIMSTFERRIQKQ